MSFIDSRPHPEGDVEQTLKKFAKFIAEHGLEAPSLFFLELQLPLSTVIHTGIVMLEPVAAPFFGSERIHSVETLFAERKNVARLMELIESYSLAGKSEKTAR